MKPIRPATGTPPNGEINITPLVDVVLVLLIIFMVATPLSLAQLHVDTPADSEPAASSEPRPVFLELAPDTSVRMDGAPLPPPQMERRLEEALRALPPPHRTVQVSAADEAPYDALIHLLDAAKRAGATDITFAP